LLCYVTDGAVLSAEPEARLRLLLPRISAAIRAGVDWIQLREKDLPAAVLAELAAHAVAAAREHAPGTSPAANAKVIVNDRLDVALAVGAAGVHLGGASMPVGRVKSWCRAGHAPAEFLVAASCHSLAEASAAERDGADYVFFGPVFATPYKLPFGSPQGIEKLAAVCRALRIPVFAIGGITLENAAECLRAGPAGLAAIRLFQDAQEMDSVVQALRAKR